MARFYGVVGYGSPEETSEGVWDNVIREFPYSGHVQRNIRRTETGESVNDTIAINNAISIVADAYAIDHFHQIKYVEWEGRLWTVTSVEVQRPRLILFIGEVYNGPTPGSPSNS